ncbi:SRPBCC family protein [Actinocorallia populi]|uniref:hypothetical protein n=1 Tax=Actinocorallia populi TaxID=2079200 RepID=UPI000D09476D|nr:hypothetical protein [Actinocorallia populi]
MKTFHRTTVLPADADRVWEAMQYPATFLYVCRGLLGVPSLAGRSAPLREGDQETGLLTLFHLIPFSRHTIHIAEVDAATRTIRTSEHGGPIRVWRHTLHAEPLTDGRCRYSDTVEFDAGRLTPLVAAAVKVLYRHRHRRWHGLVRRHLRPADDLRRKVR